MYSEEVSKIGQLVPIVEIMHDELSHYGTVLKIIVAVVRENVAEGGVVVFEPDDAFVEGRVGEDGGLERSGFDKGVLQDWLASEVEFVA